MADRRSTKTRESAPAASPATTVRDGDGTRARILAAATAEFSANGYSGARVDAICKAARANPRMIYHYFSDKDGLYVTVLEQVLSELRNAELKLAVDNVPPMQGMLELFDFIHDHFGRHPELIHLLIGENLMRARFLSRSVKTPIVASPLIDLIAELLRRGEREGVFRQGIDPLHLYVKMVALSFFHRSNAYTLSIIFRTDVLAPRWQDEYRKDGEEMLRRYLSRDASSSSPTRSRKPRRKTR
ncbi:MAG TPA: TetR/AcrR family transcriptional regulator [Polyangiaceae bacterium]|jgi:AcrR family transcriptional regulator|nr:TetR/AcrR family transcriptional regulator [Polyangiaceae bacterium]